MATDKTRGQVAEVKDSVRLSGFNSIFAVSSIAMAKAYYLEFKRQMQDLPEAKRLRVATIFSYAANEDVEDANGMLGEENSDDTSQLDASSRDFLESAIKDYNALFKTHYDTSADRFQNYYKDLSLRMKNREVDILIVVNMFLTGFDATTLNTLWVIKTLSCTVDTGVLAHKPYLKLRKDIRQHCLLPQFGGGNQQSHCLVW